MKVLARILLLSLGACFTASAVAQQPIVIKFSHVVAANTPKGRTVEYFKKIVEERTRGVVKVEVYHNSVLYKDKEEMEALQMGAVQMLAPTPGKFGPLGAKEFEILDLPFIFDNLEEEHRVTQGPIGRQLLNKLESRGIIGLAFWDNGFKEMTANKPLHRPEDLKGLKMRIQSSKVIDSQMRAVGAIPQVMAFSEIYQALQTGVVDGQENPTSNIYSSKFHEVQKYLTMTDHGYHGYAVITNKKFWNDLPPDIRSTVEGALKDATAFFNNSAKKDNDDALEDIRKSGKTQIIILAPAERLAWKRAMVQVHQEWGKKLGEEILQAIYRETHFDPNTL